MSLYTDEIIGACRRICEADPRRDKMAEEKLKEIGFCMTKAEWQ